MGYRTAETYPRPNLAMLGSADHYVPILKSKAAELRALNHLTVMERSRVTPLLEIIPGQVSTKKQLETLTKQLVDAWGLKDPLFIDLSIQESCLSRRSYALLRRIIGS
jgi:hypothetical protein